MVDWLVAIQAQERAIAPWSIGQRTRRRRIDDVQDALARGSIVRTHVLRPTWHYVRDVDARWLLELTAPRVHARNAPYMRKLEIDASVAAKVRRVLERALEGSRHLTRVQIVAALDEAGVPLDNDRLGHVLMHLELERVISSGAPRGKQHTYALFDERVPPSRPLGRSPTAELALRYFTSRGMATVHDFATWSGLTLKESRRGLDELSGELTSHELDGRTFWSAKGAGESAPKDGFRWLQAYDEYVASYPESRDVHRGRGAKGVRGAAASRGPAPALHVLVRDGLLVGRWRRRTERSATTLEVRLDAPPSRARSAELTRSVKRFADFHGVPVEVDAVE